jgi:hypothetical protein
MARSEGAVPHRHQTLFATSAFVVVFTPEPHCPSHIEKCSASESGKSGFTTRGGLLAPPELRSSRGSGHRVRMLSLHSSNARLEET